MDQILKNLSDPAWWFTGIFFIVIGILLTKSTLNWIPNLWVHFSKYFPEKLIKFNRWNKKRILLEVKNSRQKDMKVVWLIGRYWSMALLLTIYIALITIYFALSKNIAVKEILNSNQILTLLTFYALMLYVAAERKTLKKIISEHHHWKRVTRRQARRP